MAYGVKYELDFSDIKGNKRSVQILKKDYTGDVLSMVGTDSPVVITYDQDDDFYNPIIGSTCVLNLKRTDTVTYDEFQNFDEREYKVRVNIGVEDESADIDSPLWQVADTNWNETDYNWATGTVFQVYWEGFLVSDTFREAIQFNPYDISLRAMDNLGTLDSYIIPDGKIETNADGSIKVAAKNQINLDSAFYYLHKILFLTGLDFDIYIQNNIKKVNDEGIVSSQNQSTYHDILIDEFALMEDFAKIDCKTVLENILRLTNSRVYQANSAWYVVSNSNYYDKAISGSVTGAEDQNNTVITPTVTTDAVTSKSDTGGTLNGTITDDKGLEIIERGFYFGTNPLVNANLKIASSDTTASFTSVQTGLVTGTPHYITAYAKNNINTEGLGSTIQYTPGEVDPTDAVPVAPTVQLQNINKYTVENDKMLFTGQFSDVGTSNVTEYGFYFGTNGHKYDASPNVRYVVATGVNISVATAFAADTSSSPFSLTLTAGTPYYITAFAVNTTGEGVSDTTLQYTWNSWELRKESNGAKVSVPYTSDSRTDQVTISTTGSDCYTITVGQYLASLTGLPTISGSCSTSTSEPPPSVEVTCKRIVLYRSGDAKALCCQTPTSKEAWINGTDFLNNTGTTKVYIDEDCSTLLSGTQYLSEDLDQYRKWNGTNLENKITCQSSSVDKCEEDIVTPDAFLVENEVRGNREYVQYSASFTPGQRVVISSDSDFCYDIIEEVQIPVTTSITISSLCTTGTPTPAENCPTMAFRARYLKCGDDVIEVIGNNVDEFPQYVKQISTGDCYSFIDRTGNAQSDDNFNLACTPTAKFTNITYSSCDDCLGVTSTTTQVPTTTTTTQAVVYYRLYRSLTSGCGTDDVIKQVSNQTNSFPKVITDGLTCYESLSDGGNGTDGDVDDTTKFPASFNTGVLADDCAACNAYLTTTTTQTPTTTQAPCTAIQASVSSSALNVCCGAKPTTIYIDSTSLSTAGSIYTNSACTTYLGPGNFVHDGESLYFWNGNTISTQTCPGCP